MAAKNHCLGGHCHTACLPGTKQFHSYCHDRFGWYRAYHHHPLRLHIHAMVIVLALVVSALTIIHADVHVTLAVASYTWDGGGSTNNWSEAANWSLNTVPGVGDTAIFNVTSSKDVTINTNVNVNIIRIGEDDLEAPSVYSGVITQAPGVTITVGKFRLGSGTFIGGDSTMTITNDLNVFGGANLTLTSGTTTIADDLTVCCSSVLVSHNNGTVVFDSSNASIFYTQNALTLNNVTINKTGLMDFSYTSEKLVVAGNATFTAGHIDCNDGANCNPSHRTIELQGNLVVGTDFANGILNPNGKTYSIDLKFTGANAQTITMDNASENNLDFMSIEINKTSADNTVTLATDLNLDATGQDLALTQGSLNLAGYVLGVNDQFTIAANGRLGLLGTESSIATPDDINAASTITYSGTSGTSTISTALDYGNLVINGNGGTFQVSGGETVRGNLTVTAGILDVNNQSLAINGNTLIDGGTLKTGRNTVTFGNAAEDTVTISSGTLQIQADNPETGIVKNAGTWNNSGGTISYTAVIAGVNDLLSSLSPYNNVVINADPAASYEATGDFTVNGATTITAGTLDLSATLRKMTTTGTLTVDGGTLKAANDEGSSGDIDANGAIIVTSGTLRAPASNDTTSFTVAGSFEVSGTGTFTPGTGHVVFDGTGAENTITTSSSNADDFNNITIGGSGTWALADGLTVNNYLTVSGGTINANGQTLTVTGEAIVSSGIYQASTATQTLNGGLTVSGGTVTGGAGTIDVNGNLALSSGTLTAPTLLTVSGNFNKTGGTFTAGAGTLTFDGSAASQTFSTNGASFNHVVINNTNADVSNDSVIVNGSLDVNGNLTITDGELDDDTNDPSITLAGNFTVQAAGSLARGTGTLTFDGTGTATLTSNGQTIRSIQVEGTAKTVQIADAAVINVLTIGADDIFETDGNNLTATTLANNNGILRMWGNEADVTITTMDVDSGTVEYVGRNVSETIALKNLGTTDYYNLTINDANGSKATFTADGDIVVAGALNVTSGTLSQGANAFSVSGAATVNGGTLVAGSEALTLASLTVSSGTFTGSTGAVDVNGNVALNGGTFTAPSGAFTVSGNWSEGGGTFTPGTNTVTFDGASGTKQITSGGSAFHHVVLNDSAGTATFQLQDAFSASGTLTLTDGIFDANDQTVTATGLLTVSTGSTYLPKTGTQTLAGGMTVAGGTFTGSSGAVDVNGNLALTSGILTAPSGAFTIAGSFTASSGTFTPGSNTVTFDAGSGTNTITLGGRSLHHVVFNDSAGTATFQPQDAFSATGTVTLTDGIFDANGQTTTATGLVTVSTGSTYLAKTATQTMNGGLTVAGGTFTGSSGAVDVNGNLILSGGTLTAPSGVFTVSGNWTRSGGTFTPGTYTLTLDGTNQTINNSTTFRNLTKNVTSAATLTFQAGQTQTVAGTLTLSGAAGQLLSLRSSADGQAAFLNATVSVAQYADVKDMTAIVEIACTSGCLDSTNNILWTFSAARVSRSLQQTLQSQQQTTTAPAPESVPESTPEPELDSTSQTPQPPAQTQPETQPEQPSQLQPGQEISAEPSQQQTQPTTPERLPEVPVRVVINDGDLVKEEGAAAVYLMQNGWRRVIPSKGIFVAHGYTYDRVKTVSSLADIPAGSALGYPAGFLPTEGMLVKNGRTEVYLIERGTKRWIVDEPTFYSLGYSFEDVVVFADDVLVSIPDGAAISNGTGAYIFTRQLTVGDSGEEVRQLQILLKQLGFFPSTAVSLGNFGEITKNAVIAFQQFHRLSPLGIVGPATREALNSYRQVSGR